MANSSGAAPQFSSRVAFVLAAIGSSVGLGNLWRFPYVAGENGGGAFVLFYVLCVVVIGLPVLAAELFIGRRGGGSAVSSVEAVARAEGAGTWWSVQAWLGVAGAFVILTFYSVIAGWVIAYAVTLGSDLAASVTADGPKALLGGAFARLTPAEIDGLLVGLLNDPVRMIAYHGAFMLATVLIVVRGVKGGLEAASTILMPAFFVMLLILMIFSLAIGDRPQGLDFLLGVRLTGEQGLFEGLADGSVISKALGQAFFSIGLGSGLMLTYGAYLRADQSIPKAARTIGFADTAVGVAAGLAIFPIVFQVGLDPSSGPTLMFQTLPRAFAAMPGGALFGIAFFILAFFAAITSSIALLEAPTALVQERMKGRGRAVIAWTLGIIAFVIGVANALSQVPAVGANGADQANFWNVWAPADAVAIFKGMKLLDFLSASTDVILPVAGFFTAVFAGWIVSAKTAREALGFQSDLWFNIWRVLIRFLCPVAIASVVIYSVVIVPLLAK